jgi:hypothetical protein
LVLVVSSSLFVQRNVIRVNSSNQRFEASVNSPASFLG